MPSDYSAYKARAQQQYDAAFHLLKVTFPLVKDPKLLLGVVHNLFASMEASMDALLAYERQLHLIPAYQEDFQSKFNLFRYKCVRRNHIPVEIIVLMQELREILELHTKSPMEFQRGNNLVICDRNYLLKTISLRDLQNYLFQANQLLDLTDKIIRFQ